MSRLDRSDARSSDARSERGRASDQSDKPAQVELAARDGARWSQTDFGSLEKAAPEQVEGRQPEPELASFTKERTTFAELVNRFDHDDSAYRLFRKNQISLEKGKFYYAAMGSYAETMASVYNPPGIRQLDAQVSQEAVKVAREGAPVAHGIPDGLFSLETSPEGTVDGLVEVKNWTPHRITELAELVQQQKVNLHELATEGVDVPGYKYKIQMLSHQRTAERLYEAFSEGKLGKCGITAVVPADQMQHLYRFPADADHEACRAVIHALAEEVGLMPEQVRIDYLPWKYTESHQLAHQLEGRLNSVHRSAGTRLKPFRNT